MSGRDSVEKSSGGRETSRGLPVVSVETVRAIKSQFTSGGEGKSWGEHLEEVKRRLIEENPLLVEFLEGQIGKYPPELSVYMIEVAVVTIALLEQQASANKTAAVFGQT